MSLCRFKNCPVSLLFRSFYDRYLAEGYICAGHGVGLMPLFILAVLSAIVFGIYSFLFLNAFSPEIITERIESFPTIEIRDGRIVEPKNFFQRFPLSNGVHLVLDTTEDASIATDPSPNEIYVSRNGVQFVKGHKVELMPISKLLGADNITITAENITEFVNKATAELTFAVPFTVFMIAVPLVFLKYVVLVYMLALFTYIATLFSKTPVTFESRMRLATVSALPVFMFNFVFGTIFGLFHLGMILGVIITLIYLYYYVNQMPAQKNEAE